MENNKERHKASSHHTMPNRNEIDKVLSEMPEDKRSIIIQAIVSQHYSGPIPPASELAKYKETLPDAPERIMSMAETQQKHRNELERALIKERIRENKSGQIFGFFIVLLFLFATITMGYTGYEKVAIAIMSAATILVCIFVLKIWPRRKD